jgi:hypothetical protein
MYSQGHQVVLQFEPAVQIWEQRCPSSKYIFSFFPTASTIGKTGTITAYVLSREDEEDGSRVWIRHFEILGKQPFE